MCHDSASLWFRPPLMTIVRVQLKGMVDELPAGYGHMAFWIL